ncbi:protein BPS1, chloroplastic-like [Argentina anserina]|uniref:protein BPS1, chloroplastic-like n=1 Tax=Argentina anserina TaxID=57926 RepID=UPI0021765B6F|nr:protein BPS1, chloroplastic-like [Potentilla anserina]
MFLTEIKLHAGPSFTPFKKHHAVVVPNNLDFITRAFDDALLRRLSTLSPPSISFSWLSKARRLISNLEDTALWDDDALAIAAYLDDTVKLLDICNSLSAEIERLRHRRVVLASAARLLGDGKVRIAREILTEWEGKTAALGFGKAKNAEVLVSDLAMRHGSAPRGKSTKVGKVVRRTVYAVGLVTVFVAGAVVSAMSGSAETVTVRAPAEFCWAESLNELGVELKRRFGKAGLGDVATRVGEACEIAEGDRERLNDVVKEVDRAMGSFCEGLEGLSKGVNELFHGVLSNRNFMLDHVIMVRA